MQSRLQGLHFLFANRMGYRADYYVNAIASVFFILISAVIILTFSLPDNYILGSLPNCDYKASYGKECAACGLTRSFCEISKGNIQNAIRYNSASIPLFTAFLLYQILFAVYIIKYLRNKLLTK